MHWRKISDKKNFEKAAPVSNSCKQSSVSQLCTGSGYAWWWPKTMATVAPARSPNVLATWKGTNLGFHRRRSNSVFGWQKSRSNSSAKVAGSNPSAGKIFRCKVFLFKSYSRHFRHFYWWLPFAKLITTKRARGRAKLKKIEQPVYEPKISSLSEMELDRNET